MKIDRVLNLLEERVVLLEYFNVPPKVMEPIKSYYMEMLRKAKSTNARRITKNSFPPKKFELDFTGTNYEFLNSLDTTVTVKFSLKDGYMSGKTIVLPLGGDHVDNYYSILEHELLHIIQSLIKKYRQNNDKFYVKGHRYGGLANKAAMRDVEGEVNPDGYRRDSNFSKRVKHGRRPIEHLPNLNTILRRMELSYVRAGGDTKDRAAKREYFKEKANSKNFLSTVKNQSMNLYRQYVKTLFDAFVNGEPIEGLGGLDSKFDVEVDSPDTSGGDIVEQVSSLLNSNIFSIEDGDVVYWSELEDGNWDFMEELMGVTPYVKTGSNRDGYTVYKFPMSPKKIAGILKKWKDYADGNNYEEEKKNTKTVAENMLGYYSGRLSDLRFNSAASNKGITSEHVSAAKEYVDNVFKSLWGE